MIFFTLCITGYYIQKSLRYGFSVVLVYLLAFLFSYLNATSYDSFLYERDNISLVTDIFFISSQPRYI